MDEWDAAFTALTVSYRRGRIDRRGFVQRALSLGVTLPMIASALAMRTGSRSAAAQEGGSGGTLVFDLGSEPENLDPHQALAYTTALLDQQICEGLVFFGPDSLDPIPWLAESWESSPDGLEWTFTLRQGVKFHDGSDFTPDAVKFSFDRQLDPNNPYYRQGQWSNAPFLAFIKETKVAGDNAVTFVLAEPYNKALVRIGGASIVSQAAVEKLGEAFIENPVGTGPYKFDRWDKGQQVVLTRNDAYWNGKPGLDEVYFKAITEEGARLAALLSGEVSMALDIAPQTVEKLQGLGSHTVAQIATGALWFLAMNVKSEPFTDLRVRQAVNYAIDKRAIAEDVLKGTVQIAHGPLSPAYQDYNPKVEQYYPYDPDKAKQLLTEAGWPVDREVVFRCSIGGSGMLLPEDMATVIQDNLRAIGMQTKLEVTEFVSWMDAIRTPQNELTVMSWNLPPIEPDVMFNGILSKDSLPPGFNTSYWVNDEVEQLIKQGRSATDPEQAKRAYARIQEIVMDDAPIVPVCHRQQVFGLSNAVQGFAPMPSNDLNLRNAWIQG